MDFLGWRNNEKLIKFIDLDLWFLVGEKSM